MRTVYAASPVASAELAPWFSVTNANPAYQQPGAGSAMTRMSPADDGGPCWRASFTDLWIDPNHTAPGVGYLSLLACAYSGAWSPQWYRVIGDRAYDLRGAQFSFDIKIDNLRIGRKVRLLYWAQFRDLSAANGEGRNVNLAYVGRTLDAQLGFSPVLERGGPETRSTGWVRVVIPFDPTKTGEWICYGSNPAKAHYYGYPNSLDRAFQVWDCNMGLHALYGPDAPMLDERPAGTLSLRNLTLEVDHLLNPL